MIKRPSFPVTRADPSSGGRFDRRLTVVAIVLAIILGAAVLVRSAGPMTGPEVDPNSYLVGP